MKNGSIKQRLISAALALVMMITSLLGTTFAWFTDEVTSAGNKIETGTLKVELSHKVNSDWVSLNDHPDHKVFDYDKWEPGYTQVETLKVANLGSLALQYRLSIEVADGTSETGKNGEDLADVIDVYVTYGERSASSLGDITANADWVHKGTLAEVLKDPADFIFGQLLPTGEVLNGTVTANTAVGSQTVSIALHMQESADNEYQKLSVGDIYVNLIATQWSYENDSFGNGYDNGVTFPSFSGDYTASAPVEVDNNNSVKNDVILKSANAKVSATVPEGTLLLAGINTVTLTVSSLKTSESNIEVSENQVMNSVDVHVSGIAARNSKPILVTVKELLAPGLNMGNYQLYHVENGTTVKMTYVADVFELDAHNEFTYDPVTGDVTMALCSFSEVAVVADTENAWKGEFDYTWYTNAVAPLAEDGEPDYVIANADQLAGFGAIVGGMAEDIDQDSFTGKTVKLLADIDLGYKDNASEKYIFYPIGYYNSTKSYEKVSGGSVTSNVNSFEGTFDGNGNIIMNFYQNTWEMFGDYNSGYSGTPNHYKDAMGLFGYVLNGTVKNLTVDNFSSDGEFTPTGVIAAYAVNSTFENIAITNCNPRVYNTGNGGIVGIGGDSSDTAEKKLIFKNITIDNTNKISALWGSWDVACGGLMGMFFGPDDVNNASRIEMTNCHVAAQIDVNNDVCGNYQYYWYRYSGMMVGTIDYHKTENGYTVPDTSMITASGCTVHFGDWNDYYYCELVANSLASYTHDHQFSRLTEVDSVDTTNMTVTVGDETTAIPTSGRYNYVVVNGDPSTENATCYHFVDGNVWDHDDAGYEDFDLDGNGKLDDLKEDRQHYYLPFNQLFTGYGWGVKNIPVYNGEEYAFDGITVLDRDIANSVKKFETKFTSDFLYRVGNQNTVSLGSLFAAKDGVTINGSGVYVTIDKVDDNMNVSGTFTANTSDWTKGTIQFSGTGVVKVTIQDYNYCQPTELYLEVVDAYNRTTASFSGNSVLLNDVSTSSVISTSGVLYGNGFTINMENAPISEKNGAVFHLYDGAFLKNVSIVGKEFTTVAANVNDTDYGISAIRAWGTVTIENCYISGCRSAVSVTGTELTIKDSVIANGVYANVDFRSGILNLHNVTTINEPHTVNGTTIVGLGIVGNMTASAGRQLNITGTLTQYNWLSQADCANIKSSGVDSIFNSVFTEDKFASLRYTYNRTTYVNTGILSLCSDFGASAVSGTPSNYSGMNVNATISGVSVDGYVWAPAQAGTLTADDMKYHDTVYQWSSTQQGTSYVAPSFDFDGAKLTAVDGVVQISYESGNNYTLTSDTIKKLLSPTKYGQSLSLKISMSGVDYTDKGIVFDATTSQTYTLTYTIIDDLIYDKNGKQTNEKYNVTKDLKVFATVVDKSADAPTFTFYYGTNGSASAGNPHTTQPTDTNTSTIKQVGNAYYIMPNATATIANAIGSQTVDGETVYYPIVDGINVRSGSSTDYDFTRYYPVFKAVKISDNGTEYSYSTTEMPDTVAWVSAAIDEGNGASALNDGFSLYNNQYLCKVQKKAGNAESGGTSVVKFSYTALDGNTYYYYVGFRFYDENEGGGCVTGDALVTLADGTQKRIDEVTYEDQLLVWDFFKGEYAVVSSAIIFDHGYGDNTVIKLNFNDGTSVKVVNLHQFLDANLNQFVTIDADSVAQYIGHEFVKQDGDGYTTVTLVDYEVTEEYIEAYGIISALHYNILVEGMFSTDFMPADYDLFNYFEIGENMKYDAEQMQTDIEKYGLYTYEDFADYLTYEQFVAFNVQHFKIAVEKGDYTYEDILALIDEYLNQ